MADVTLSYQSGKLTSPGGTPDLNGQTEYGDEGVDGLIGIPSWTQAAAKVVRQYVFGFFHESTSSDSDQAAVFGAMGAGAEMVRERLKTALATWSTRG